MGLSHTLEIDALQQAINEITNRPRNPGDHDQTALLLQLLREINNSGLSVDSIRFLVDFLNIHLGNLPTVEKIQRLIEIIKEIEAKGKFVGGPSDNPTADWLNKFTKPGGGAAGIA